MSKQPSSVVVDDNESRTSSSSSPKASFSQFLVQNQNSPDDQNQTLEDALARLSISPFNFDHPPFIADGSFGINGALNNPSFDDGRRVHRPQRSNLYDQMQQSNNGFEQPSWNNYITDAANDVFVPSSQSSWVGYDGGDSGNWNGIWSGSYPALTASGYCSRNNNGFLDYEPWVRQTGFGRGRAPLTVPLSNGGADELQQIRYRGGVLNDQFLGVDVNGIRSPQHMFTNLRGRVLSLAKDQNGCRVLKEVMKTLTVITHESSFIFFELIDHVAELMVEPFGNYIVQKLVEICSEKQRTLIILRVIEANFQLIRICLNPYGSRAVEKLLEHVTTQQQRNLIMSALSHGAVALATDINGNRVMLHCLKYFSPEDNKYLLRVVANNCFVIATDKTGCCVLQHCVDYAQGETKKQLIAEIVVNASLLANDPYGNYVVQHLVSKKIPRITECLLRQFQGKFLSLSSNKFGSNVVEKIFQESGEQYSRRIILELLNNPDVAMLLVDPFGNYVITKALSVSKGAIQKALLQLIAINSPMMRNNIYGKKLLEKVESGRLWHS